jgi:SAM-dependent methyltransferase
MVEKRTANATDGPAAVLPPRFDATEYLARNPDLAIGPVEAEAHYLNEGRARGLVASPLALRENLVAMIADGRSVLEIGPFCNPLLRGPKIAYLDVLDADQLRARAREIGLDPEGCPAHIDYVGGLERVKRRFDAVVSSHAIEHQPDLIHHLQQIERILEPDGLFCLIIPDKRYCFDHFLAESTIAQVLQAHREQRRTHSLASIVEHVALTTHNDSRRHWRGDHGEAVPADRAARLRKAMRDHDFALGSYVDVHAWYFTPDRFAEIVEALGGLGLIGLELASVYDTVRGRNEFCAVLRLSPEARRMASKAARGPDIKLVQCAGGEGDAAARAVTAPNIQAYARRHGYRYALAQADAAPLAGDGWAVMFGPDGLVGDLDFDLSAYLNGRDDRLAIAPPEGNLALGARGRMPWLLNLGHAGAQRLVSALEAAHDSGQADLPGLLARLDQADAQSIDRDLQLGGPLSAFARFPPVPSSSPEGLEALAAAVRASLAAVDPTVVPVRSADGGDRWSARYAHQHGLALPLIEAPVAVPDRANAARLRAAWERAGGPEEVDRLPDRLRSFAALLAEVDDERLAEELAALGRSRAAQGLLGGDRQHARAADPAFAAKLSRWTHDKLVSLAEAVGCLRLENPEFGPWGDNGRRDPAELFAAIESALGADLSPPPSIGAYLGIGVGGGRVIHMRMLDAIHAAWRVGQLADQMRSSGDRGAEVHVGEVGAGIGLAAFYAQRLGQPRWTLVDGPTAGLLQQHVVGHGGVTVCPSLLAQANVDLILNSDSLPELPEGEAVSILRRAHEGGVRAIVSINHEAVQPGTVPVAALFARSGGYTLASRHRHWLRTGYVEEVYRRL